MPYTRNVYKCIDDVERKKLRKTVRKRYYEKNKEAIRVKQKLAYEKKKLGKKLKESKQEYLSDEAPQLISIDEVEKKE